MGTAPKFGLEKKLNSQDLSMCVNGWESEHDLCKNAYHLFTRYISYSRFGPSLMNYFFSLETDIWVEREKKSVVLEKINISKKQPALNELRQTVFLK